MKKHVPTKLKDFFCEGDTWTRNVVPGRVRCGYWTAYLHEDGRIHSFGAVTEDAPCPQDSSFARSASRAITALWTTIDVPKVFRTRVGGERRTMRWVKGDAPATVRLLGKWPMIWDTCRVHNEIAEACLRDAWYRVYGEGAIAVHAAVEHFWGPELRHDHVSSVGLRADEVWISTALQGVDTGRRNDTCHKLATYFFGKRLDKDVTTTQLLRFAGRCRPPLDPSEVVGVVDAVYTATPEAKAVDGWSFTCAPDKVNIARCLREAYAAGLREAVIEWDNDTTVYFHREVWPLLARSGQASQANTWSTVHGKDWAPLPAYYAGRLARAREWEAAQTSKAPESVAKVEKPKAPTVTVTLKGTR